MRGRRGRRGDRAIRPLGVHLHARSLQRIDVQGRIGRWGDRALTPFGASSAACPSSHTVCIGPYGTAATQQLYTGHNTRTEQFVTQSSPTRLPRQQRSSTNQRSASSSKRNAAEENASPAKVALHPRRPHYFIGGINDDVYVWTSIVDRWLDTVQGEPSQQLTFIVSLLRGAAYEWYMHYETRTGCPGD